MDSKTRRVIFFFYLDPISANLAESLIAEISDLIESIDYVSHVENVSYRIKIEENHNIRIVMDIEKK